MFDQDAFLQKLSAHVAQIRSSQLNLHCIAHTQGQEPMPPRMLTIIVHCCMSVSIAEEQGFECVFYAGEFSNVDFLEFSSVLTSVPG